MGGGDGDVRACTAATGLGGRCGDRGRMARAGWRRGAVDAPSNLPTQAAWSPWGLGVHAGPTTRLPGGRARRHAARGRERQGPEYYFTQPCLTY
jgi:hypothetical protein